MKKFISFAVFILGIPGAAFAQSCVTTTGADNAQSTTCLSGGVPQISSLNRSASLLRNGAVSTVGVGQQLLSGDRLVMRPDGSGTLSMSGAQGGSCSVALLANSTVTISQAGGNTCFSQRTPVASNPQPQLLQGTGPSSPVAPVAQGLSPLAIGIGGAIIAGGAGLAIAQTRNDRLSP